MATYKVNYLRLVPYCAFVDADSVEEAADMYMDGTIDYANGYKISDGIFTDDAVSVEPFE